MDIALHPDFGQPVEPGEPEHNYVYAFYVVDPPDTAGKTGNAGPDGGGNRFAYLVRFTADAFFTDQTQFDRTTGFAAEDKWQRWEWFTPIESTPTDTMNGTSEISTTQK
jgi:hypothetical protein